MRKKHLNLLEWFIDLFEFKSVFDNEGNEYVLYASNEIDDIDVIQDKTAFEAVQNHIHFIDNIKSNEKSRVVDFSKKVGKLLLDALSVRYPNKHFVVFVTIDSTVIIRFHQKWDEEPWYFMMDTIYEGTTIICFDN